MFIVYDSKFSYTTWFHLFHSVHLLIGWLELNLVAWSILKLKRVGNTGIKVGRFASMGGQWSDVYKFKLNTFMIFYFDSFMYLQYHSACHHCERLCHKTQLPFPEARKSFFLHSPSFRAAFDWGLVWWFAFQTWGTIGSPSGISKGQCEMTISRAVQS